MSDPTLYLTLAGSGLAGLAMMVAAGLAGWRGWLELKHRQIAQDHPGAPVPTSAGARIELADLKERVRKLEAIAAGVDL